MEENIISSIDGTVRNIILKFKYPSEEYGNDYGNDFENFLKKLSVKISRNIISNISFQKGETLFYRVSTIEYSKNFTHDKFYLYDDDGYVYINVDLCKPSPKLGQTLDGYTGVNLPLKCVENCIELVLENKNGEPIQIIFTSNLDEEIDEKRNGSTAKGKFFPETKEAIFLTCKRLNGTTGQLQKRTLPINDINEVINKKNIYNVLKKDGELVYIRDINSFINEIDKYCWECEKRKENEKVISEFSEKINDTISMDSEIAEIIDEKYWELL